MIVLTNGKFYKMKRNIVDRIIESVAPGIGRRRLEDRVKIDLIEHTTGMRRYEGAAKGRNASDWLGVSSSSNIEIQRDMVTLRNRSRELGRNNPYIKNWLRIMPNNIVGVGIIPTPVILSRGGNAAKMKEIWKIWAEDVRCDYDQRFDFYGLQHQILKTVFQSGECIIVRRRAKSTYAIPVRLQVLEADYIDNSKFSLSNEYGGLTWYGIEFNGDGDRVGYWLWDRHPGEFASMSHRVDAKDIIHVFNPERPGQVRGVPDNHAALIGIKDLNDYEYSERLRAKVASCLVGAITQDDADADNKLASSFETLEPGTFHRLRKGEGITFNSVPTSNGYSEYVNKNLHSIAAGIGCTFEAVTGDFSNVNFSSGRMGWLEFQRSVDFWQNNIMIPACNGLFAWFVEAAQVAGFINIAQQVKASWTPPRREMIDPVKEMKSLTDEVRSKLKTWHEAVRERGYNPEEVLKELEMEYEMFKKTELKPITFPEFDTDRTTDALGAAEEDSNK
jgi:lambda family phage portal protein